MEYTVEESDKFSAELESAVIWLYFHNCEQSQEFADRKSLELRQEVKNLEQHLTKTPYMGKANSISRLRCFPLYDGRYLATWKVDDKANLVILLEFLDSKYPKNLREFSFDE
jgi:hypothetical protein